MRTSRLACDSFSRKGGNWAKPPRQRVPASLELSLAASRRVMPRQWPAGPPPPLEQQGRKKSWSRQLISWWCASVTSFGPCPSRSKISSTGTERFELLSIASTSTVATTWNDSDEYGCRDMQMPPTMTYSYRLGKMAGRERELW